eukprot:TRINITY_DN8200_c0_g1_i2.p1 TRINITY_DN8200_c0_g1~~TRINITY_DN8200_c0_g1_i2.p1  ORF type:complete len:537 (-),score=90.97 TRINITY_DN8200_c0_g1_i2:965-2575(-)
MFFPALRAHPSPHPFQSQCLEIHSRRQLLHHHHHHTPRYHVSTQSNQKPNLLVQSLVVSNLHLSKCRSKDDDFSILPPPTADDCLTDDSNLPTSSMPTNALFKNMGLVGMGTITSKITGVLREIILAAVFGVGPVATAYSKHPKERRRHLIQGASAVMFLVGGALGAVICIFAEPFIYISAPGLWSLANGQLITDLAVVQLKLMTPCILFAGPIGLGLRCFSAEGDNIVPCLSLAVSNITTILLCATYIFISGSSSSHSKDALYGGLLLSCGASLGAFLKWLIQVVVHGKNGYGFMSSSWKNILKDKDLCKLFSLMLPATISSGMAQTASFTDLYFASFIPGAAAALSYAHLLAMAPLGILLSTIMLPLIPTFSRLEKSSSWPSLKENLQQAILLCVVLVLPITLSVCVLAKEIISILFQRFAFDSAASTLVSSLLICYSIGSPFYVIRELLVVVYYALEDGKLPFLISVAAILLNGILDWLFISQFNLGAQGLVLSTSFVTALSTLMLFYLLLKKLPGTIYLYLILLRPCSYVID